MSSFLCDPHGGECCGMKHIYNFPITPNKQALLEIISDNSADVMREELEEFGEEDELFDGDFAFECVLTKHQLLEGWDKVLKEVGFKETAVWQNPNTGNMCHQFVLTE